MKLKLKRIISQFICIIPFWPLRWVFYRFLLGYEIHRSAYVGMGTELAVSKVVMKERASIGRSNKIIGDFDLVMEAGSRIGFRNQIIAAEWVNEFRRPGTGAEFRLGGNTRVANEHRFDLMYSIVIGSGTRVAGAGSQFWTHGPSGDDAISIGDDCYLGTAVVMLAGASLGRRNLLAAGGVLSAKLDGSEEQLVGGVPARALRSISAALAEKKLKW